MRALSVTALLVVTLVPAAHAAKIARLTVHPENPRWFQCGGKTEALFGSGLWTIIPDGNVDIKEHNEWYSKYGANANRATLFAFCSSVANEKGLAPWKRTGPGNANDGLPKYDFSQWDERYWARLHQYLSDCSQRGIIVLLQMWDEPFIEAGPDRWKLNPFNPENNVSAIPGLPRGNGPAENEFYDPDNLKLMRVQGALIQRLLDETSVRYGNIIYELGNEICLDSDAPKETAWQKHWIDLFNTYERKHGVRLMLSNDTRESLWQSGSDDFPLVNHHGFQGFNIPKREVGDMPLQAYNSVRSHFQRYNRPIINSRPASDPDRKNYPDIVTEDVGRALYWSYFCGGGQVIGFRTTEDSWKDGLTAERIIRSVQTFAKRLKLERFIPMDGVADQGLCLADEGHEYVVYLPQGGNVTIDLTHVEGRLAVTWYNPRTSRDAANNEEAGGGERLFKSPGDGDWVLHIIKK